MSLVGEAFLDLLEQDDVWRTSDGRVIELASLDARHRTNVLCMLERIAGELYRDRLLEIIESFDYRELAAVRSPELQPFFAPEPEMRVWAWFEGQPLIRRLRALNLGTA